MENIILNDYLSLEVCRTNIPMLYFVDDYTLLSSNYYWFLNRTNNQDVILDVNANALDIKDILKN